MADAYSYALLVDLGESGTSKLKNKLVKYFQSRKSGGGDCQVDYDNGSRTATLRFRTEEDQKRVLAKGSHQIPLDKGVLKVTVSALSDETPKQEAPSDKPNKTSADVVVKTKQSSPDRPTLAAKVPTEPEDEDDEAADEELSSTLAVIRNIPEKMSQDFLEMLVENIVKDISPSATETFTLELNRDISSAVVTFQSGKETAEFVTRCPQKRAFTAKGLSVLPLELTQQVVVEDLNNLNEDLISLYFENEGGEVEKVELNEAEGSAIITFKDHKDVQKVVKKKHHIKQEEVRVYPFYQSLGTALYGKDKPSPKLPAAISEAVDSAVWRYLNDNQSAAETVHQHMAKHFCNVDLSKSTVLLSPESSLLQQKDAKATIKEWRDTVKSAFSQALSKFKSLKLQPESELWEESEKTIRQTLVNENVVVVSDKGSGVLSVAGPVDDVTRVERHLHEVLNKVAKRVQREKSSTTKKIKVSQSIFNILCQDGLEDKLQSVYPDLKMSFGKDSPDLTVTGLNDEIITATQIIVDAMLDLRRQNLEIDKYVLDLLKDEQPEELTDTLLTSCGINAAFEIKAQKVRLVAVSDKDLNVAAEHLVKLLITQCVSVEDSEVLRKPEWAQLVSQLENDNNKSCRRIRIHVTGQEVVVSGHKDDVMSVSSQLDNFLKQNARVEETVVVKSSVIVEFIKKLPPSRLEKVKDKVAVSYRKDAICLNGSRGDVTVCKKLVESLVSSLAFQELTVCKPGVKTFFQANESMYVSTVFNETGCLVQLVDGVSGSQDSGQRQVPKPVYQLQSPDGVEIAVCKADMCSYPMHAVVNAATDDLKHESGLSRALLTAAGPQLQDECDKLIRKKGKLKPGQCVITGAGGQLCCNKVIHAVGPRYDSVRPQTAQAQLKKAVQGSLELAEHNGCTTVALPTISRNLGFPLDDCTRTIVTAVREYCDEKYNDNTLKMIHFVDCEDSVIKAMEAAVRQVFGNHGVSPSKQTSPSKAPKPPVKQGGSHGVSPSQQTPPSKQAGSDQNCLGRAQTKEGLGITLMKGNIQHATTEVTVNTVFEDLVLNKGAVSNAIFSVAGPKLQQSVHAIKTSANVGEVIVTEGCKLKSKQVFHAVTPHWDNGQGTADKILSGIFKDCLDKAEDTGQTSISFPAIGTGNLGFPKDLVASLMLDEILAFSAKSQPKVLKEIVIILYPGDAQTIQVFNDEFNKKFPSASGVPVPVPTSSPQSTGGFSKVVSSQGMYETNMGSVVIQAVTGDITKESTDVIVNSSNEKFTLKSGVSKAILEAAGFAVEEECQDLGSMPNPGMIMTQPGNLKCKKILHLAGRQDPVEINKVVKEALQMCETNSYTSVSFPAIGTGQGNAQARKVADAMLDAVIDVLGQNPSSTLNTIRIVIFQQPMLKEFHDSMKQREATDPKDKPATLWGSFTSGIKSGWKSIFGGSSDKPKKDKKLAIEPVKVDPAYFHICGESQAKVDTAKQRINNLISKEQESMSIADNAILSLSDADCKRITDIQKTMSVSIKTEDNTGKATIIIEGLNRDVIKASNEIHKMINKARDEEEMRKKVEMAGELAEWLYHQGSSFHSFDPLTNYELEQALKTNQTTAKVKISGKDYTIDMANGIATDNQGGTVEIKRIDKLKGDDIPSSWETMPPNTTCQAFPLTAGSPEYTEVEKLFRATCTTQTIIKMERIQNPAMWTALQIKKRDMELRNTHQNNEKRLFHGTSEDTLDHINELGFNRSYAGKNAAAFGNGTYFALEARYSACDTYSKPNQNGEKFMYLCRVLTGDYTLGKQGFITPPAKGSSGVQKYDSVVNDVNNPTIFVIFHDSQAYPEYLITFK